MNMESACFPCIFSQIDRLLDHLQLPRSARLKAWGTVMKRAAGLDPRRCTSPEFAQQLSHAALRGTGIQDPYRELKRMQNRMVRDQIEFFRRRIAADADPLRTAVVFSLMGNAIDYGSGTIPEPSQIFLDPGQVELRPGGYKAFRSRLEKAGTVLLIGDNAGEAVLDGILIEEMCRLRPGLKVTFAVRSRPAINDVTEADAHDAGLASVARIVRSGSPVAGTLLAYATRSFRTLFQGADLVIAKGQGNFETLETEAREIYFLFKVKCAPISRFIGLPEGSLVLSDREQLNRSR